MRFSLLIAALAMARQSLGVASYDEYRDADVSQSGYLPNHNMDPSIVDSSAFGQIWKVAFNPKEQFYAKPLTYTPLAGGPQLLFMASSQNWIRTLNAKTGALVNSRQVHTPFLQSDIGCADIPDTIGIIGTPIIDPATDTVYFYAKTYIPNFRVPGNTGTPNGVYYFHAVNINTLADIYPPVLIDGSIADNDPRKYFHGGVILQRPSLTQIGSVVYGAFGGHCDLFNYTGVVIGVDINKAKIVTQFAVESGPLTAQTNNLLQGGGGGEAGIWMSGMSPATDGQRLFVVSGNGVGHENFGAPASGSSGCRTLGESAINLAVDSTTGGLALADYFQPYDYIQMDGNDQDFGAGGLVLLDPATFSGGSIDKMAVTAGKNGKIYIVNANNLGGYKLGAGQTDGIIQTIPTGKSVFGAAGSYPLEGGYIYVTPVGYPTYVYQLGFTSGGVPQFSKVAETNEISAGRVGVGVPTLTSLDGQPGTAILWMTDPDAGIRAWYAVPENGAMKSIPMPQIGGANKFQRPAFGDGRVYTTDANGVLYCLGSPVNLPLNCTSPVDFGQVALGAKATRVVNCTATAAITSLDGLDIENDYFKASNASLPKGPLAVGVKFSIPVTWDLTNVQITSNDNASYSNVVPGIKSTPLTLFTTNAVPGFATLFPISLIGTQVSTKPFLAVTPSTVDFGGIIVLDLNGIEPNSGVVTIANKGLSPLTILGYAYTNDKLQNSPTYVNSTIKNGKWDMGPGFSAVTLPAIGTKIAANKAVSIDAAFFPTTGTGVYNTYWQVWSDGGSVSVTLEGSASTAPVANFSISNGHGGWLPQTNLLMDFGKVAPGSSSSREIRLCNNGGSSLQISKSKPPYGVFHISDPTMLHESQLIATGACAYGEVLFVANTEEYNQPDLTLNNSWTLNANDLTWGVHVIRITGTVVSNKVGPINSTGETVYQYLGCFKESTNGPRLFPNEPLAPSDSNSNGVCQTACLAAGKYAFAGTEFGTECWCGNTPPPLASFDPTDTLCNFGCPGDSNDRCGATGYVSVFYDPTKYVKGTDPALYGPQVPKQVGNYNYLGCYSEGANGRALSDKTPAEPAGGFTLGSCMTACQGYTYWGMEYANQCYCGNILGAGSVNQSSSDPTVNGCNMVCKGDPLQWCGGGSRLNLYILDGNDPVPTSTVRTLSTTKPTSTGASSSSKSLTGSLTSTSTPAPTPTGPITVTNLPGWSYLGCYSEATTGRALNSLLLPIPGPNTDVETCGAACAGYAFFGVEYGQECYCGNVIRSGSVIQESSDPNLNGCSIVCAANPLEYCGGGGRLNIYQVAPISSSSSSVISSTRISSSSVVTKVTSSSRSSTISSKSSLTLPTITSVSSTKVSSSSLRSSTLSTKISSTVSSTRLSTTSRSSAVSSKTSVSSLRSSTLSTKLTSSSKVSTSSYRTTSISSKLSSSTVKPSSSSSKLSTSIKSSTSSRSTLPSSSSSRRSSSTSSKSSTVSVKTSSSTSKAFTTSVKSSSSKISTSIKTSAKSSSSTSNRSTSTSKLLTSSVTKNTSKIGTTTKSSTASTKPTTTLRSSTTTVKPSSSTTLRPATTAFSSSRTSSRTSSSTRAATSTGPPPLWTGTPVPGQMSGSWKYMGCANEVEGRTLSGAAYASGDSMTVESCQAFCAANNFALAGIEYSSECYCHNQLTNPATLGYADCTMPCNGNTLELCGGPGRLSVFNNTAYVFPSHPKSVGQYTYQGCYQEAPAGRLLGAVMYADGANMSVESCVAFCQSNMPDGTYAGVEYSSECYCASTLPTTAVQVASTSCNMLCSGNNKEYCGAGGLLDVYRYQPVLLRDRRYNENYLQAF
ncbi:WSC-domain-containing protein [Cadophora sp. DSE1049]|nr:WSC-domain-containing protein [Cadophora sp. DSE1049]